MAANPTPEQEIEALKEEIKTLKAKLDALKKSSDEVEQTRMDLERERFEFEKQKHQDEVRWAEREYQLKEELKRSGDEAEQARNTLENQRYEIEKKMHDEEIELVKLDYKEKHEAYKNKAAKWIARYGTTLAILVPLLIAAGTILAGYFSAKRAAQESFDLKIAELVMNSSSPIEMQAKAQSLATLFPDKIDATALANYEPTKFSVTNPERQKELLDLLVAHPERKAEIVALWNAFYGEDSTTRVPTDPAATSTPVPVNQTSTRTPRGIAAQASTPVSTQASTPARQTGTSTPTAACEQLVVLPGKGGPGTSWPQIVEIVLNTPGAVDQLLQDEDFLLFLDVLAQNREFRGIMLTDILTYGTPEEIDNPKLWELFDITPFP
jgi:hypothetical protein